jgi:hypothetical protein
MYLKCINDIGYSNNLLFEKNAKYKVNDSTNEGYQVVNDKGSSCVVSVNRVGENKDFLLVDGLMSKAFKLLKKKGEL